MTTPEERQRAQAETRDLLRQLSNENLTPGIPERLRQHAKGLLRHLASPGQIRDTLEMALNLLNAEQERDKFRKSVVALNRMLVIKILLGLAAAFITGLLVGRLMYR